MALFEPLSPASPTIDPATRRAPLWPIALAGFAAAACLCWPQAQGIWETGNFIDTDDAMRMVQVRAWLDGQGWSDLTAYRLDPPLGSPMHWSRVVDVPLGALLMLFRRVLAPEAAELATRLAYPLLLQAALLSVMAALGDLLCGRRGAVCAVALTLLSGFMWGQFVPGRVDHHSMQILLLMVALTCVLAALDPRRARLAWPAAAAMALSLAVSLETLPHLAATAAILPAAWALDGRRQVPALKSFALGLLLALPAAFLIFRPADFSLGCDAFSVVQLEPGIVGALGCLALAHLPLRSRGQRGMGFGLVALATVGAAALHLPCYLDPFTGLDPLVRAVWLAHTTEARSLSQVLEIYPSAWPLLLMPPLLGLFCLAVAAVAREGYERSRWVALLPVTLAAALTATWIIRAESLLAPLALLGGIFTACQVWRWLSPRMGAWAILPALLICLPFSSIGWAMLTPLDDNFAERQRLGAAARCREASAYGPLARMEPGLVFAPMDAGAHLLAHTSHTVLAAPYHRNNRGNRLVIDAWLARPVAAERLVRGSGARWLMVCPGEVQLDVTSRRAPDGLGAQLLAGQVPDWLVREPVAGTPFEVYRLR